MHHVRVAQLAREALGVSEQVGRLRAVLEAATTTWRPGKSTRWCRAISAISAVLPFPRGSRTTTSRSPRATARTMRRWNGSRSRPQTVAKCSSSAVARIMENPTLEVGITLTLWSGCDVRLSAGSTRPRTARWPRRMPPLRRRCTWPPPSSRWTSPPTTRCGSPTPTRACACWPTPLRRCPCTPTAAPTPAACRRAWTRGSCGYSTGRCAARPSATCSHRSSSPST